MSDSQPVEPIRATAASGGRIELVELTKSYGSHLVLKGIDLVVEAGEFFSLLGPSGCGKTTTLNLIAGLLDVTGGEILIGDRKVNDLDPKDRKAIYSELNLAVVYHDDGRMQVSAGPDASTSECVKGAGLTERTRGRWGVELRVA